MSPLRKRAKLWKLSRFTSVDEVLLKNADKKWSTRSQWTRTAAHFILYCVCYCNKSFYSIKLFYLCVSRKLELYICFIITASPWAVKTETEWNPAQYTALNNSKQSAAGQKHPLVILLMTPLHFTWCFSLFYLLFFLFLFHRHTDGQHVRSL